MECIASLHVEKLSIFRKAGFLRISIDSEFLLVTVSNYQCQRLTMVTLFN